MKKKLLFLMSMLMVGTAIHAVPAKRGIWKTFTLKTGQTVQVQLCGDEFLHFWEDKDGNRYSYDTSDGLKPANMAQLRTRAQVMRQQQRTFGGAGHRHSFLDLYFGSCAW